MKPWITTLGICAILVSAGTANAVANKLKATGNWNAPGSWAGIGFPNNAGDTATFSRSTNGLTVTVTSTESYGATDAIFSATAEFQDSTTLTTTSWDVDASSRTVTMTQTKTGGASTGGTYSVTSSPGTFLINSGTVDGRNAKYQLSFGDIAFTSMTLDGDVASNSNAKAILDLDQSVSQSSSDVTVKRVADMEVLSGKTFTINDLLVGSDAGNYNGTLSISAGGTIDADRVIIEGDSGSGSKLSVSSTTLITS